MTTHRRVLLVCVALIALACLAAAAVAAPSIRTPGYRGITKPIALKPATAPPASALGTGSRPDLLVDAAGTAHVVWTDAPAGAPTRTMYCRVPRGARACEVTHALDHPGSDQFSVDVGGPAVAAVNDQVVVMSHRYPQVFTRPDGSTGSGVVWLWTSDDGGQSFAPPAMAASGRGPNTAVAGDVRGGAVVFGTPEVPRIAVATDTVTGGVSVTTIEPGRYTPLGAAIAPGDFLSARLAVLDGRPVVVYADLGGNAFMRRWTGAGDPNDAATWTPQEVLPGFNPEVTVAGGRLVVALTTALTGGTLRVLDITRGGAPVTVNPGGSTGEHGIAGLPDGRVVAVWRGVGPDNRPGMFSRVIGAGGRPLASPVMIGPEGFFGRMAATADGGGMVASESPDGAGIRLSSFGTKVPTGLPGLGSRTAGTTLPPDAFVGCQRVRFGAVEALTDEGCFLNAAAGTGKASLGPVRLNGLIIIPDPGVQVVIDPRRRSLDSTGTVRVLLRARGLPEILLYRGRINVRAEGAGPGASLFSFSRSVFSPEIFGFRSAFDVDVQVTDRGVRIPLKLRLPSIFSGVYGDIVLRADNTRGLIAESLDIGADDVPLGVATIRRLRIQYREAGGTSTGNCLRPADSGAPAQPREWAGVFEVVLPPPAIGPALCASARFGADGLYRAGTFNIDLPAPGIPLFPAVAITGVQGGLQASPVTRIDAGMRIGVITAGAGGALVDLDGRVGLTFGDPFLIDLAGAVSTAGVPLGEGRALLSTDGYARLRVQSGLSLPLPDPAPDIRVNGIVEGFADGPGRRFSLTGRNEICVGALCGPDMGGAVSTRGLAVCGLAPLVIPPGVSGGPQPVPVFGIGYRWGDPLPAVYPLPGICDLADYEVTDRRGSRSLSHQAGGEATVRVPPRTRVAAFRARGAGGIPDVDLLGPDGVTVVPRAAVSLFGEVHLEVRAPRPGTWTVRPRPGSVAVTELAVAGAGARPVVRAVRITGAGRRKTLSYRATLGAGQAIVFVESGPRGERVIGSARPGAGALAFSPGPGPAGRRRVLAQVSVNGVVRSSRAVAAFRAPAPAPVGRARGLLLRRAGTRVVAVWRPGTGVAAQRVTVRSPAGGLEARSLGPRARRTVIRGVGRGDRVRIEVVGTAADGRRAAPARAALRVR